MKAEHYENYHAIRAMLLSTQVMLNELSKPDTFLQDDPATELKLVRGRLAFQLEKVNQILKENRLTW